MSINNGMNILPKIATKPIPLLSIVIPTYGRNKAVVENVKRLLPQIQQRSDVELIILDNCSPVLVSNSLEKEFGHQIFDSLSVIRNVANIGLVGNSLRVFEVGSGTFIWTLCDDDAVSSDAVNTVVDTINQYNESVFLWFPISGGPSHCRPGLYNGLLSAVKSESNLFFIALSSCVFQREFFVKRLRFGYLYAYSWAPFICPLLSEIDNVSNKIFVSESLVATAGGAGVENKWSKLDVCLGIRTLLELPMSDEAYTYLKTSIDSFSFSTARLFLDSIVINDQSRWKLFRVFVERRYTQFSVSTAIWTVLSIVAANAPRFTRYSVRIIEYMVGRPLLIEVEDRFARS